MVFKLTEPSVSLPTPFLLKRNFSPRGEAVASWVFFLETKREPTFAFEFAGVLFEFEYTSPAFEPLLALPPDNRPRRNNQPVKSKVENNMFVRRLNINK